MPDITNPEAIKFANEIVRPLAEEARAFRAKVEAATTVWYGGMNAKFPNDASEVDDGRANEGVSRLDGADVNNLMGNLIAMAAAGNAEIISKPCVRPLSAN